MKPEDIAREECDRYATDLDVPLLKLFEQATARAYCAGLERAAERRCMVLLACSVWLIARALTDSLPPERPHAPASLTGEKEGRP